MPVEGVRVSELISVPGQLRLTHVAGDTLQEQRLDHVALDIVRSSGNLGSLADGIVDDLLDTLRAGLGKETTERRLVGRITRSAERRDVGLDEIEELLGDRFVNDCGSGWSASAKEEAREQPHWQSE